MEFFSISSYHSFISPKFARHLLSQSKAHPTVKGLKLLKESRGLETPEALTFLVQLYEAVEGDLARVLRQRQEDRKFIDERTRACTAFNRSLNRDFLSLDYKTVIGLEDSEGRVVFGPLNQTFTEPRGAQVAALPEFLQGPHVTLFGPPDSAKLAMNAMNSYHRRLPGEPPVVERLLAQQKATAFWGADDEDSKTPLHDDLIDAAENLTACFEGNLRVTEKNNDENKSYALAADHLALPIKRIPGLALPSSFLFYQDNPLPLHLYDFALHLFKNHRNPRALVFYIPKLESEEEAAYIHKMIAEAERLLIAKDPSYRAGTIRLMIVLENPRAILRTNEIIDALHPYFAGASLGWHDYLASMARLCREDPNYRIPVKADPQIVIKHIQASQIFMAKIVGARGGIKVGGMYGILPIAGQARSLSVTLKGFIKDVISQFKRDLNGFWVAHPDFVRIGLALVEAWSQYSRGDKNPLAELIAGLLEEKDAREVQTFIENPDVAGLSFDDPQYLRSLIVTNIKESDFIANNHPDEIRYNIFQSLQYLADWLAGNGCVALPTVVEGTPVRVMDDLATAERSRWEVWHEIRHGRFSLEQFIQIVQEEMNFIRRDLSNSHKIVQVKWDSRTAKWYPIAMKIMIKLMTDSNPVEFATELLLPFTHAAVRDADDPWKETVKIDSDKFRLEKYVHDFNHYFEICGAPRFAEQMAVLPIEDFSIARQLIESFTLEEILCAAGFHGDIGQSKTTLDHQATSEQAKVLSEGEEVQKELLQSGKAYLEKFGFKFLTSAQGRTGGELLKELKARLQSSPAEEIKQARAALWSISEKRLKAQARGGFEKLKSLTAKHQIRSASVAINYRDHTQTLCLGETKNETLFQIASLSKSIGSAYAIEYFNSRDISIQTSVNSLFKKTPSSFRLRDDAVTLEHLMSHSALNMHYVPGVSTLKPFPPLLELLEGKHGYSPIDLIGKPGESFHYSGGGFIVLEHLLESLEGKSFSALIRPYLDRLGLKNLIFNHQANQEMACGYMDDGKPVENGHLNFPLIAAGAWGDAASVAQFLRKLTHSHSDLEGRSGIPHDVAVQMLAGQDLGSQAFMGCNMGVGVFTIEAGPNRLALHQGANEGFRAIFLHCVSGPDSGKGVVVLCNGDNRGVHFIAEVVKELLQCLQIQGVQLDQLVGTFDFKTLPQEQIVNLGYKQLLLSCFEPDLPEKISSPGKLDPLSSLNRAVGAKILYVSNQKFARAENLLSPYQPTFDPSLFGRQGKIMDSWESARHNQQGVDVLVFQLAKPCSIRFARISTQFHDGNHVEYIRLEGLKSVENNWEEMLPKTSLQGHSLLELDLGTQTSVYSQIRVEVFPDGGLTRLGLFEELPEKERAKFKNPKVAQARRFVDPIPKAKKPLAIAYDPSASEITSNLAEVTPVDPASLAFGGSIAAASNEHYGPAIQVISPYPPIHMFDGLESARSRKYGHHEEVTLRFKSAAMVHSVTLDFQFFVNNNPLEVSIDGMSNGLWEEIFARCRVKAYAGNQKRWGLKQPCLLEQIRIKTFPDGGINRIRVNS